MAHPTFIGTLSPAEQLEAVQRLIVAAQDLQTAVITQERTLDAISTLNEPIEDVQAIIMAIRTDSNVALEPFLITLNAAYTSGSFAADS